MICCVTGHRPNGFPFPRDENDFAYIEYRCTLSNAIRQLIAEGCTHFISGMAYGADLDFADMVLDYASTVQGITLEAALPYPIRPTKTSTPQQEFRDAIVQLCAKTTVVCPHYHRGCMHLRNRYMVDCADIILAIWNGSRHGGTWYTIQYAKAKNKPIRYIMLNDMGHYLSL